MARARPAIRRGLGPALAAMLMLVAPAAWAQQPSDGVLHSPLLTVDQEELFVESEFGRSLIDEIEAAGQALAAENRRIEAELVAEERSLTEARATLDAAEFKRKAADFDDKVVAFRTQQDEKARDLVRRREAAQKDFYGRILPILTQLVRERGAVVVLESRAVILSADQIDITDEAIARIDAALAPKPDSAGDN